MLLNKQWSEAQESRVILQENSQCTTVFDKFLAFFYTGRVCITQQCVLPLLCLADKYNVKVCTKKKKKQVYNILGINLGNQPNIYKVDFGFCLQNLLHK